MSKVSVSHDNVDNLDNSDAVAIVLRNFLSVSQAVYRNDIDTILTLIGTFRELVLSFTKLF